MGPNAPGSSVNGSLLLEEPLIRVSAADRYYARIIAFKQATSGRTTSQLHEMRDAYNRLRTSSFDVHIGPRKDRSRKTL